MLKKKIFFLLFFYIISILLHFVPCQDIKIPFLAVRIGGEAWIYPESDQSFMSGKLLRGFAIDYNILQRNNFMISGSSGRQNLSSGVAFSQEFRLAANINQGSYIFSGINLVYFNHDFFIESNDRSLLSYILGFIACTPNKRLFVSGGFRFFSTKFYRYTILPSIEMVLT